ncbi:MAG: QueT transporter family protein, partial [Clostridia bacterium]|nr:QueT transporter family protein [Clostridia bacterium]
MKNSEKSRFVTVTGIVAGLYAALTVGLAPLSFGLVQCRAAELLTVLAVYTPAAVPGLTVGCVISNLIGLAMGANIAGALDVVLGPLATGLAAWLS